MKEVYIVLSEQYHNAFVEGVFERLYEAESLVRQLTRFHHLLITRIERWEIGNNHPRL